MERAAKIMSADIRHVEAGFRLRQAIHIGRQRIMHDASLITHEQDLIELSAGARQQSALPAAQNGKRQQQQ